MKRLIFVVLFSGLFSGVSISICAQVVPAAQGRELSITAGAFVSGFQSDYQGNFVPFAAPNLLIGPGAYVDIRLSRWVQAEAEGRWLNYNQYIGISQSNYLLGPRLPIEKLHFWRATPYVKVLAGIAHMNFEYGEATGRFTDIAYGAGLDVKLNRRISIRAADFEYQEWPRWLNTSLYPYGVSVGVGYKIF
jgi:hypothetical protein